MKNVLSALSIGLLMLSVSCESHDAPDDDIARYRLASISGDDFTEIYTYDHHGLVCEWKYIDSNTDSALCNSTYRYAEDGSCIVISSEEDRGGGNKWIFDETLYLNPDGTAKTAIGTVELDFEDELVSNVKKNYIEEFLYNDSGQLVQIKIAEKPVNALESAKPLEWSVLMDWDNGNLMEYSEAYASGRTTLSRTYSYYDGLSIEYPVFIQTPILRHYYTPLLYQGVLGCQSRDLVKGVRSQGFNWDSSLQWDYTDSYSYTFSTSSTSSRVEEFVSHRKDAEIKYEARWEKE